MASIDAVSYDQPAYNPGAAVHLTLDYTPDSPSVVPTPGDVTLVLTDANGNQLASVPAPFTVSTPQPSGDKLGVSDVRNDVWAQDSDTGSVAVWSTTA